MIEIVQAESNMETEEKKQLPKDIKQIGNPGIGDRIYVENQIYQYIHDDSERKERNAYLLLGEIDYYAGRQCVFVQSAVKLETSFFKGDHPMWNDSTWSYVYKCLGEEHKTMAVVGWALDKQGWGVQLTEELERIHLDSFGGTHQILWILDTLEQEEAFFGKKNGSLCQREGFYLYFDKKMPKQIEEAAESLKKDREEFLYNEKRGQAEEFTGMYRKRLLEQQEKQKFPVHSIFLVVAAVALIMAAVYNYQRMGEIKLTLNQVHTAEKMFASEEEPSTVTVEIVPGAIEASQTEDTASPLAEETTETILATETVVATETIVATETAVETAGVNLTEAVQNTESANENPPDEAVEEFNSGEEAVSAGSDAVADYLAQGYYIVEKGDSMIGISRKIYQTPDMVAQICEKNGITNPDNIKYGQRLLLP